MLLLISAILSSVRSTSALGHILVSFRDIVVADGGHKGLPLDDLLEVVGHLGLGDLEAAVLGGRLVEGVVVAVGHR